MLSQKGPTGKEEDLGLSNDNIFLELASDNRLAMLFRLYEKDSKLSELAKELDLTIQEVHRNTTRLLDSNLITKTNENFLFLTPYGKMIIHQISAFQFLVKNKQYFQNHSSGELPVKFIERFGSLNNYQLVHGMGPILEKLKAICLDAKKSLKIIISEYSLDAAKITIEKVKKGINCSYIFGENTVIPKGRLELLKKTSWEKFISAGSVERRMLDNVQVSLIMNESQACLFFPNLNGETDMMKAFHSEDNRFLEWSLDYFNYQWKKAGTFKNSKLEES